MKKVFLFIALIFISSLFINIFLDHHYKKFWGGTFNKLETVFKDTTYIDIVFVGDSRVHFGINPFYIDSITNKNSYNIGMGGAPINEIIFLTKAWLNNHKTPKTFVISVGLTGLVDDKNYFSIPCYYFYFLKDTLACNTMSNLKYHTTLSKIMPITKFTAFDEFQKTCIVRSIKGESYLKREGVSYKGFINNDVGNSFNEVGNFKMEDLKMKNNNWMDIAVIKLNTLITLIEKSNCQIIFVYPPYYRVEKNKASDFYLLNLKEKINELTLKKNIKVLAFDNDTSFSKSLFQDPSHLNIQGSILYSKKLGLQLKDIIK